MLAKYILAVLALLFVTLAAARRGRAHRAQRRTWLIVAFAFAAVSAWLFHAG